MEGKQPISMYGRSKSIIRAQVCCLHFKARVDNMKEMQERGTSMIQGLEKLPPSGRVVGEMLKVQLDLHPCKEVLRADGFQLCRW